MQLALDVQRFELMTGRSATLEVTWSARQVATVPSVMTCTAASTQAASGLGIEQLAAAQQRSVRAVAAQIGATLRHWYATGEARCERQDLPTVPEDR